VWERTEKVDANHDLVRALEIPGTRAPGVTTERETVAIAASSDPSAPQH
jgi:hypothetical protein